MRKRSEMAQSEAALTKFMGEVLINMAEGPKLDCICSSEKCIQ
jgi:hypothetical protein